MPSTLMRRPLPALVALVALLLLTALVWWRVLNRDDGAADTATQCPTPKPAAATLPAPAKVTVEVLNATARAGIAAKARTTLVDVGFAVPKAAANDKRSARIRGVAEIRYGPSGANGAKLLRYYFPGATLVPVKTTNATVVVSLGRRYTRVAPLPAVQAAMKADNVVVASPSPAGASTAPGC